MIIDMLRGITSLLGICFGAAILFYGVFFGMIKKKILKYSKRYVYDEVKMKGIKSILTCIFGSYIYRLIFDYKNPKNIFYTGYAATIVGTIFIILSFIIIIIFLDILLHGKLICF